MNEIIRKRKSTRKYDMQALDADTLANVQAQFEKLAPLYADAPRWAVEITDKTKAAPFAIAAPHYLVFRSLETDGAYENIGFIGQQMDLYFSANGLGVCWLGMAKPETGENPLPCIICMAFGRPAEPLHRDLADFKRKTLTQISEGEDARLDAARLAPSGMNAQNWYFVAEEGSKIHCYRKKPLLSVLSQKLGSIDLGIALCHIAQETENFRFAKQPAAPERKGCIYMGTVL
ncbi:MAG: nitroreductase [Clostridiales bacterium]|nr:nitroreductase [Clostridiales bacterium]